MSSAPKPALSLSKGPTRYGIVVSRFNPEITDRLLEGALAFLRQKRVPRARVTVVRVPGAFELPVAALTLARSGRCRAVVALGCILKGETPQYEALAQAATRGLMEAGVLSGIPVTNGVIVAQSWRMALARSGRRGLNRGREAAQAAWELAQSLEEARAR